MKQFISTYHLGAIQKGVLHRLADANDDTHRGENPACTEGMEENRT